MAFYPDGKFMTEFARRTLANLRALSASNDAYQDTALLSSLLAVFVLPHERADPETPFMAELLSSYGGYALDEIVEVLRRKPARADTDLALPETLREVPRFLRNAVAHLNVKPESSDGVSLTHLLVWNTEPRHPHRTTFVARLDVVKLRSLAEHILERLSKGGTADRYNGIDPIKKFDDEHPNQVAP